MPSTAPIVSDAAALARENEALRQQLLEAQDLIEAIRTGAVDALAVQGAAGPRIFTLQGADEGYRTLIEQMTEGALLLMPDATVLYGNACLAGWLQQDLALVMGAPFASFVPADFQGYWAALLARAWAGGQARGELPLRARDGSLRPLGFSMNVLSFNDAPTLAVIATDLSAQREVEVIRARVAAQNAMLDRKNEELRQQEAARRAGEQAAAEARRLLEGIPQIAWTANAAGVATYLNSRWFDFSGQTPGPPPDALWAQRIHPHDAAPTATRWGRSLRTGEPFEVECRFRNRAGDYRWMLGRALPSRDETGAVVQWIGTCTDIDAHKRALARIDQAQHLLRENNAQLTRANVDLDAFVYTASHDLKVPISNIEGLLHALQAELPPAVAGAPAVQPLLGMMQDSVDRFRRTIGHLTEVVAVQQQTAEPAARVALAPLIRDVQLDLAPEIAASAAHLEVDIAACPTVAFPEKNLRSVVFNLLSNALKYRHPARPPHVQLRARPDGDFAVLEVQDNGLGFDPAQRTKLFALFERLHDHVEGSGIGLYMVKKMVDHAGGRVEVASQLDAGTTFSVYLPS